MTQSTLQQTIPGPVSMPPGSPLVVLAFLGTGAFVLIALGAAALCLALKRRRAAAAAGGAGALAILLYGALLVALSLTSRDRVLAPGGRKYFCEIDCHLAYSVAGVERLETVGVPPAALGAQGRFVAVRVRTWFDPATIASFRGDSPLTPNPREAWLADGRGRRFTASAAATRAYEEARDSRSFSLFTRALPPGASYETALVFDVPADATALRLFVGDPPGVETTLLGHENSPWHGRTYFSLD